MRLSYPFPKIFGAIGYHMWFLGFLFAFSLVALPLFIWLKGEAGRRFISRLAGLCEHRGVILLFILPLAAVRLVLQPFSPELQDWADFFFYGAFFVLGYLLFTDERFTQAIRRDWLILLGVGIAATLAGTAMAYRWSFDIEKAPVHVLGVPPVGTHCGLRAGAGRPSCCSSACATWTPTARRCVTAR